MKDIVSATDLPSSGDDPRCPHCGNDLQGAPIPEHLRGEYYGGQTHYSRIVGVVEPGVYDGVLYWRCPDCGGTWHRWAEGSPYRRRAEICMRVRGADGQ